MDEPKTLGTIVTEAMAKKSLWAAELARIANVPTYIISKVVNDRGGCGPRYATALSKALDLDPVIFDRQIGAARKKWVRRRAEGKFGTESRRRTAATKAAA